MMSLGSCPEVLIKVSATPQKWPTDILTHKKNNNVIIYKAVCSNTKPKNKDKYQNKHILGAKFKIYHNARSYH